MKLPAVPDPYSDHRPHRELGNQYALRALRERRAFMTGELIKLDTRRAYLTQALEHLDATLAMISGDYDPTLVKARFPRRKSKLFGAGKLNALILGVLRKADRPMSLREIVAGVTADAGFEAKAGEGLKGTVRANLLYLTKVRGLTEREGEREEARWRLA